MCRSRIETAGGPTRRTRRSSELSNSENRPFITSDGRYLFFNSDSGGSRDIYWIDMEVVRRLDPLE